MIKITARNFKLTEGIKTYINEKLTKFEKFLPEDDKEIDVVLEANSYGDKVEVMFKHENKIIRAEHTENDLYVAVDLVVDKLEKRVRRNSDKLEAVRQKKDSIRYIDTTEKIHGIIPDKPKTLHEVLNGEENSEDKGKPKIVRRKKISSKPMFEEEAVEQMEALGHQTYMFNNASTETMGMLYKRNDGDYGLIEVE